MEKLVVTCAVTGSLSQKGDKKGQSPYLPVTPDEIVEDSVRAYNAGATIVHLHARDPKTGAPSSDVKIFKEIVDKIRSKCEVIINCTTGGGMGMSDEERIAVVPECKPQIASLNMGSLTYGIFGGEPGKWLLDYPWGNSFKSIEFYARTMHKHNCKPEMEIYDTAMLNAAAVLAPSGAIAPPFHFQFVLGLPGQVIPATAKNLSHLAETAKIMFPDCTYSVCAAGRAEFPMVTLGAILGAAGIRIGMEDNIYIDHGTLAKSNGELVEKAIMLARGVGREIASVAETKKILRLT